MTLALVIGLFAHVARPHAVDEPLLEGIQWARPGMATVAWFFNDYLHHSGIPALWTMTILWLLFARNRGELAALFVLAVLAAPLNEVIKEAFDRPRPAGDFIIREHPSGMSFPSAHTMMAMTFFGLWALAAPEVLPRVTRWPVRIAAAAVVLLTALSRVWVAAHWPTDVVAGMLFGGAFVGLLWASREDVERIVGFMHERLHTVDIYVFGAKPQHVPPRIAGMEYAGVLL